MKTTVTLENRKRKGQYIPGATTSSNRKNKSLTHTRKENARKERNKK